MSKHQVKFYLTDEEKERLDILAKLRFMKVPTYAKMMALGVQIRQIKEVYLTPEDFVYPENRENFFTGDESVLLSNDKALLEELLQRSTSKGFIQYDADFNERLQAMAKRLLEKE